MRAQFATSLGMDLDAVRVHEGTDAANAATAVRARAYTTGNDIYFGKGEYRPDSAAGRELLAHEVAHTVQQSDGAVSGRQNKLEVSSPDDRLEVEADMAAAAMIAGQPAQVTGGVGAGIQRVVTSEGGLQIHTQIRQTNNSTDLMRIIRALENPRGPAPIVEVLMPGGPVEVASGDIPDLLREARTMGAVPEGAVDEDPSTAGPNSGGAGMIAAWDAHVRVADYVEPAQRLAAQVFEDYRSGQIDHMDARIRAYEGRAGALGAARERLSPGARAMSEAIKEQSPPLRDLAQRYAVRVLENDEGLRAQYGIRTLDVADDAFDARAVSRAVDALENSPQVSEQIIRAAGRPNAAMTRAARTFRVLGPIATTAQVLVSTYEIVEAPEGEHVWTAGREITGFTAGTLGAAGGGLVAGWTASLACGPGAPVCALIVSFIVVGAAAAGSGMAGEAGYEALVPRNTFTEFEESIIAAIEHGGAPVGPATALAAGGGYRGLMERDRRRVMDTMRQPPPPAQTSGGESPPE